MNLQLIKSATFGEVQTDIYSDSNDMYMTINQLAECLQYADRSGIQKLVDRNTYLNNPEFSGWDNLSLPQGGTQKTRVFTEDGIYEVTMLSSQPKAKEFRAWIRKILKGLRNGNLKLTPIKAHPKLPLASFNHLLEINVRQMKIAGQPETHIAAWINGMTRDALSSFGIDVPLLPSAVPTTYDATEMAKKLGVYSKNNNPHPQPITAIIKEVGLAPGETFTTETTVHRGTKDVPDVRYSESVFKKVHKWLDENDWPSPIVLGKKYSVVYKK